MASTWLTGLGLDYWEISERALAAYLGLTFIAPGAVWLWVLRRWREP
jgi:hypothetical protein